jgi:hypothetical protein
MGVSSADCMTFLDLGPFVPDQSTRRNGQYFRKTELDGNIYSEVDTKTLMMQHRDVRKVLTGNSSTATIRSAKVHYRPTTAEQIEYLASTISYCIVSTGTAILTLCVRRRGPFGGRDLFATAKLSNVKRPSVTSNFHPEGTNILSLFVGPILDWDV